MTVCVLDVVRSQITELAFSATRKSKDIILPSDGKKNFVWKYPHTGSIILQPINTQNEFQVTQKWEALKFRLADVTYPKDWFVEVPFNTRADTGPSDYFFAGVVLGQNVPAQPPAANGGNSIFLFNVTAPTFDAGATLIDMPNYENLAVGCMMSKAPLPVNQGYMLRFFVEGRPTFERTIVIEFYFGGSYRLRLLTNGIAELWQATDATQGYYTQIYSFGWAKPAEIHDRWHRVTIAPHGRRYIEFMTSTSLEKPFGWSVPSVVLGSLGISGGGVYEVPGDLTFDAKGNPIVTQAATWAIAVSREFRPHFQVSRWAFYNGVTPPAQLYDHPINIPFGASVPINVQPEGDLNGGTSAITLLDATTGQPYAASVNAISVQFGLQLTGIGDIPGPGLASSTTPELYGYSLQKEPAYQTDARTPVTLELLAPVSLDHGDAPDSERMQVHLLNSENKAQAYTRRSGIPVLIGDLDTNIVYFEGTAVSVVSSECPTNEARKVILDCQGMATQLLNHEWNADAPDFGKDPYDVDGQAWYWMNAALQGFAVAGFDPNRQVLFEDNVKWNFRLWLDGEAGGTTSGQGKIGTEGNALTIGSRWKPPRGMNLYEWLNKFIRHTFGWEFAWDRFNHRWNVYRRPDPRIPYDTSSDGNNKFVAKVAFYGNPKSVKAAPDGLPSYPHSNFHTETERPKFNTLLVSSIIVESALGTKQQLADQLAKVQSGQADPGDTAFVTQGRNLDLTYANRKSFDPNAVANTNHPEQNNVDWLGHLSARRAFIPRAATRDALDWMGRRLYEDNCFGWVKGHFDSTWGDIHTAYLRKYDVVLVDSGLDPATGKPNYSMEKWYVYRIEPSWKRDTVNRARYQLRLVRTDARPPR